jgi:diguanylate cyclase (GGDEF)-like protein/PAS domain S-box-containing protein
VHSRYLYKIFRTTLILLVTFTLGLDALATNNIFVNYSKANGLVQNTVTDIVEDQQGFIWFSTFEGLSRFDGYEFKNYQTTTSKKHSLPAGYIKTLLIDSNNNLWVATLNGLALYNRDKDNFKVFNKQNSNLSSNDILALGTGTDGRLIVATNENMYWFHQPSDSFTSYQVEGQALPKEIRFIYSEQEKTWIGSFGHGIYLLEHSSNKLYSLQEPNPWNIIIEANYLFDIKKFSEQYWLGTELGAYVIEGSLPTVTLLNSLSEQAIVGKEVRSIIQDEEEQIWLGTTAGISVVDAQKQHVFTYDDQNKVNFGLKNSQILKLFKDSKNTIWLGIFSGGVYKYNPQSSQIKFFEKSIAYDNSLSGNLIWGMQENKEGKIWIATQTDGISLFDPDNFVFQRYLADFKHNIWSLTLDDQGKIWIASTGGVFVYEHSEQFGLTLVTSLLTEQNVQRIEFFEGKIWLPTNTNNISWVDQNDFSIHSIPLADPNINSISPLFLDSQQNLWLVTNLGMMLYNLDSQQISRLIIKFENNDTRYISEIIETEQAFWLASFEHGMVKLDKQSYEVVYGLNTNNGLASNQIMKSIVEGDNLWISYSNGGIDQVSLSSYQVLQNIASERLNFNELNEVVGLLTSQQQLLFGGTNGILLFDPKHISVSENAQLTPPLPGPKPSITQFRLFNLPVTVNSENSPLNAPIYLSKSIRLPNGSNMLSFKFAQINAISPDAIKYRYKMLGLADTWIPTDNESPRRADYSNLDFGSYQFIVQSKGPLTPWSQSRTLDIYIDPPFWLHVYALILYTVFTLLVLSLWYRHTRSRKAIRRALAQNEERLKLTLWSSGDELWDWDIQQKQVFRSNTWNTLDFPQDHIRATVLVEANIHPNDISRVQETLDAHLLAKTEHYEVTYRAKTYYGEWLWLLDRGKVVARDHNEKPLRMTGTLKNISHLKVAEEQLKLYKRSIETISDGVFITDTHFKFITVNHSYCKYTGETHEQALASYLTFHQYPGAFTEEVKKTLKQKGNWFGELESRRTGGEKYEMELNIDAITDEDGKISHYVGVFSDITSRKGTEKELLKLSNSDPLTDLPNRSFFLASHANIVRRNTQHALICLDMDNFKKINDYLGHQTGDILIRQIAKRLQKLSGTRATCYRLGGDEFSILIDNYTDIHTITHFSQAILDNMSRPFIINKQDFVLSASVGIAFYPEDGRTPQEMLKNADTAMYCAKNEGGNKYQFFSGEMNRNAVRQLQIENLIRHGLKEDLFTVYYQPKVDITTGKLVSMEALVRYEHPDKRLVSPAQFIPLAEQTGQIIEIGEVVLRKACEDTKRWVEQGLFTGRVAVNISARQFEIPDLDERIVNILHQVGLSPQHLECEITEGTLMQNPENALRMMQRLRERGIHLALDDFGTGYSSLAYLKRFPINTLKIDKAFIDDIATSPEDRHMAQAIITIAHNLGLKVVAEGVEHENQLAILRRFECEMLQGYLYSKPLNSVKFENLLKENQHLKQIIQKTIS